ncbi:MAG: Outer membrane protein assembly factor BamD precursor [Syntrophorhabdus sp. PtaU1.Bin002]|nr:MAG: Outer membrane protein assembly factor BamD precursor [Syntrophorhabdus sp. PtaU1.Bin002]
MPRLITIILLCLLLVSCASSQPKKTENPGDLYVEGVNLMKAKKYDKAIKKFSEVKEEFPFDPMALIATVKLGDVYFEQKEYTLAMGVYEDFFNTHPEDDNIPYVLSRLGECYEKLTLSMDRDQSYLYKAIEKYTYLKNRYPSSSFAGVADERLKKLQQKLADRELYVGEFYYRSLQYNAAITRLEYMVKKYPDAKGIDKAFYCLAMSYGELGDPAKSDYYFDRLRKEYPKSIYGRTVVRRERKTLQAKKMEPPSPKPETAKRRDIDLRPQIVKAPEEEQGAATQAVKGEAQPAPIPAEKEKAPAGKEFAPQVAAPSEKTQAPEDKERVQPITVAKDSGKEVPQTPPAKEEKQVQPVAVTAKDAGQTQPAPKKTQTPEDKERVQPVATSEVKSPTPKEAKKEEKKSDKKADKEKGPGGLAFIDKSKPIDIVSDTMEGFDKEKYVVFKGSVIAKQDDLYIFTDVMEAYMNEETNEISKAYAKGNVKIVKQDRTATANEAFFDNAKGEIVLKDNVVVFQGQDKVTGNIITYYVDEDKVVVQGQPEKRARAVLTPRKK